MPKEFYNLVDKNSNHIGKTFPVTLVNSDSLKKAEDFLEVSTNKEKTKEGFYFYARDIQTNNLIGYLCVKTIDYRISKCELGYFVDEVIDEDRQDEVFDYFRAAENDSIDAALNDLGESDYTREEIQLMRIKFMSELGN